MGSGRWDPAGSRACPRLPCVASGPLLSAGLGAVLGAGLLAPAYAGGVQRGPDDLVPDAREVLYPAATHEDDGVLLQVVADPGDVGGDLDARGQTDSGDLPE